MDKTRVKTVTASTAEQRAALVSPMRIEIIGLFTTADPLSIADMAERMGRPAGSLYHHVGILEKAGLLRRAGTRPKGKRFETLFAPTGARVELAVDPDDETAITQAVKAISIAFRMAERDLEAALARPDLRRSGPDRNALAMRLHLRASPDLRRRLNEHIQAIMDLLTAEAACDSQPGPDDEHLSLTLAMLPLKGRDHKPGARKDTEK